MPRDRGPFRNGERVLVPHTDKYYEAKILKTERRDDMWYYLIHYAVSELSMRLLQHSDLVCKMCSTVVM